MILKQEFNEALQTNIETNISSLGGLYGAGDKALSIAAANCPNLPTEHLWAAWTADNDERNLFQSKCQLGFSFLED